MSLAELRTTIEQLSFEERPNWLHGWWDDQIKRDVAAGKLDHILREVDEDIRSGRFHEMP